MNYRAASPAFYIFYKGRKRGNLRGIHHPAPGLSAEGKRKRDKLCRCTESKGAVYRVIAGFSEDDALPSFGRHSRVFSAGIQDLQEWMPAKHTRA
jgi:hypothetical protein